jgi:ABC-type lipoprotein export system ATPase subunit
MCHPSFYHEVCLKTTGQHPVQIERLTFIGGYGKSGEREPVAEVTLEMGDVVSIVGPTGSGKTTLINDLEMFAHDHTPSRRKLLINGAPPSADLRDRRRRGPPPRPNPRRR